MLGRGGFSRGPPGYKRDPTEDLGLPYECTVGYGADRVVLLPELR
jgi:hypothetical protein